MINFSHYQNSKDILENNPIYDDGDTFKISYEFNGKSFIINMKYFFKDGRIFGFINFKEINDEYDKDSSYLVGYIIERYLYMKYKSKYQAGTFIFYTDYIISEFHHSATCGFNQISYFDTSTDITSKKYNFYIISNSNHIEWSYNVEQLIQFLDNEL